MIRVMRPYLPPFEDYTAYLEGVYERVWLTNDGPLVRELERRLAVHWGVPHVVLVANGTLALELAARALDIEGPVLTTPFSYLATPMALGRAGLAYAYADIEREHLNLDPAAVRTALAEGAFGGVVPVHVYGNPVDAAVDQAARAAGAKLLFDASHCAAAWSGGEALVARGDASAVSLHATKLLHAVEGGAVVTHDRAVRDRVAALRNFGQDDNGAVLHSGGNAKMSEVHAAMGLAVLDHFDAIVAHRRRLAARYAERLPADIQILWATDAHPAAYQPILLPTEAAVERVQSALGAAGFETRRYFWPALGRIRVLEAPMAADGLANADYLAARVLCLPLHTELEEAHVTRITDIVCTRLETGE